MATITLDKVDFHYDAPFAPVFEQLSLTIDTTWRTALVGRNGRGKTTLLRLLRHELVPARGTVSVPIATHYFPYAPEHREQPVCAVVKQSIAPFAAWEREMEQLSAAADPDSLARYGKILEDYEAHGGYEIEARIEKELAEIGMDGGVLQRPFATLSPGEQTRALIVALFLRRSGFPLIDEPTNHLDMAGRMLLADYLATRDGFILVSHDRHFLDACADHILSIHRQDVKLHHCGFAAWQMQMAQEAEQERRRQQNLKRQLRSLERSARQRRTWSDAREKEKIGAGDKGFVGHRAAKQMKRALAIERRIAQMIAEKRTLMRNVEKERALKLDGRGKAPEVLLSVANVRIELGGRTIVRDLSLAVRRGDRTALIGPNGCGKTTLLRAIAGELEPAGGTIHLPQYLRTVAAYQEPRWRRGALRRRLREQAIDETRFRNIMAALGVSGAVFERPLETMSHGELKKVDLCRSFLDRSHLLLWDEPLNYIDLMSREQIEEVILHHQPTMLFVEHDRWFVERVATAVVEMG